MNPAFESRLKQLNNDYEKLITRKNEKIEPGNGIFYRYKYPILTGEHAPVFWKYDLNPNTNPFLMERFGVHAAFNAGAIKLNGKYLLVARVEGNDRKSFFAVAESPNGVDNFRFWDYPLTMPETKDPDTNVYDMRLTQHDDGWIYGIFGRGFVLSIGCSWDCTYQRPENMGTFTGFENKESTAKCCFASGICRWQICFVHTSAGWFYRCRFRRRNWLGFN
jgi:hypothetical protein